MPQKFTDSKTFRIGAPIAAIGILVLVVIGIAMRPSAVGPFGFSALDSQTGRALKNSDVTGTVHGLKETGDPAVWTDFTSLLAITDLDQITAAKVAAWAADGYTRLYLNASAVNSERPWCPFGAKWFRISTVGPNELKFEATPTRAGAVLFSESFVSEKDNITISEDIAFWDLSNPVGNFSVAVGINSSDIGYCAYASYFNYASQLDAVVKLVFNFNSTAILKTSLALGKQAGDFWTRSAALYNTTAISFECASFTQLSTLQFIWGADVATTGICISEFLVVWEPANTPGATTVLFRSA